jgi:putative PIN family toxin of toxin-antitoxin system
LLRAVVDTNVLVSAVIKPRGATGPVLRHLRNADFVLIYSEPLLTEVADVLNRPRLRDKYGLTPQDVETVVALILFRGEAVVPTRRITQVRDPRDNMVLEAAVDGRADVVVSGDNDLLSIEAFEAIRILPPAEFLALLSTGS